MMRNEIVILKKNTATDLMRDAGVEIKKPHDRCYF